MSLYEKTKRAFDVLSASALFVATLPIQIPTAVAIAATMGRPVLFRQERAGKDGEPFKMMKFRSMHDVDPARGRVDDASRLTGLGKFIRATSIDELPTLVNIIRGDMSVVGPRPLYMRYLERYNAHQARRQEVRPGLTGLAQVSGRNALNWEKRFDLDVYYVDHRSMLLDLKILWRTVAVVLKREGISEEGHVTMTEFMGSEPTATTTEPAAKPVAEAKKS